MFLQVFYWLDAQGISPCTCAQFKDYNFCVDVIQDDSFVDIYIHVPGD